MKIIRWMQFSLLVLVTTMYSCKSPYEVHSPDKTMRVKVGIEGGRVYYTLAKGDKLLLDKSFLGFELQDGTFDRDFEISGVTHSSFSDVWDQVWGEELTVENTYHEMAIDVRETAGKKRKLKIIFRLFNDGLGFRYEFPEQPELNEFIIMDELTEFNFVENSNTWSIPYGSSYYEALYTHGTIQELDTVCSPLTVQTQDSIFMAIHEANLTDYAAMNLSSDKETNTLKVFLTPWSNGDKVRTQAPSVTPWRTIIVAESAGDLLLSRLMLNLNEPSKIEDTSWIRPGRYIGIWWDMHMGRYTWHAGPKHGATTTNTKRYIDFAAKHGFSGVLVEGWNVGWENDWTTEGDKFNFTKAYPDFDLQDITDYARQNGVGLIGHHETGGATQNYEKQLDSAFALYQTHGVHTVKTGYVSPLLDGVEYHSSQYGVRHYRKVLEHAARYQVMINNHEPVMPTGLQRTFPNLMTQEGVRGQEWDAWDEAGGNPPEHTTIIPFTRGLAGPMDFTPGTFDFDNPIYPNTRVKTTIAKQLALAVVLYSPLQMASDRIESYDRLPEAFSFITSCPTNWSETVVPHAMIGEYITIARKDRESDDWYVGSITNAAGRELHLPLDFLDEGIKYIVTIYKDGPKADYERNPYDILIEETEVNSSDSLSLVLASGGGVALRFRADTSEK